MFSKVLVANRGEIAVRLIRGLREMGVRSVAVYSDADRASLAVSLADEAAYLGASPSSESYLSISKVLDAARKHAVEAIHPGYGFLSENADFARACTDAGFVFIGPSADAIHKMGSKTGARQIAMAAGVPVVPGTEDAIENLAQAKQTATALGYPVLLKASAGGGGKGMRRVDREEDLENALRDASSEAARAFANGSVYLEKLVVEPRHIEIQVLGDQFGHLIHLGERECSVQRRHQKVIEECPSPFVERRPELRAKMGEAAVRVAKAAGYSNAGTVEFLVDRDANFYFLEMNTRLQVEHPVTELVTSLDLVEWQLRIASGERLTLQQSEVRWQGSAVELRVYAEDPEQNYMPSPGTISQLTEPAGPGIRIDSGVYQSWTVPLEYDPLLAKLTAWGPTRERAMDRLQRALAEYSLAGVKTNLSLFREILSDEEFRTGNISTDYLGKFFERRKPAALDLEQEAAAALVLALRAGKSTASAQNVSAANSSRWLTSGREQLLRDEAGV